MRHSSLRRNTRETSVAMALNVGAGIRSNRVNTWRICETVIAGVFPPHSPSFQAQEPQRHQSQGHVVMPADPTANFIMIQPGLAVTGLEELFNTVSLTLDSDQFGQGYFRASISNGVVGLRLADGADHNQSFFRPDFPV